MIGSSHLNARIETDSTEYDREFINTHFGHCTHEEQLEENKRDFYKNLE